MTKQEGIVDERQGIVPPVTAVVEVLLLLQASQLFALEAMADRQNLTVGQLLRRTLSDFLLRPFAARSRNAGGNRGGI